MKQLTQQIINQAENILIYIESDNYKQQILNQDISSVNSSYRQGEFTFAESIELLKKICNRIKNSEQEIDFIESGGKNNIFTYLQTIYQWISQNPLGYWTNILQYTQTLYQWLNSWGINVFVSNVDIDVKKIKNEYKQVGGIFKEIINSEKSFIEALKNIKDWTDAKTKAKSISLNGQKDAFSTFADTQKYNLWLFATFIFAFITFFVLLISESILSIDFWIFKIELKETSNLYEIMPRTLLVVIPSFLTIFCANQYNQIKTLKNSLLFKYNSVETMQSLLTAEQSADRQSIILQKGTDVIFSEPQTNNSNNKENYALMLKLIQMLKKQKE